MMTTWCCRSAWCQRTVQTTELDINRDGNSWKWQNVCQSCWAEVLFTNILLSKYFSLQISRNTLTRLSSPKSTNLITVHASYWKELRVLVWLSFQLGNKLYHFKTNHFLNNSMPDSSTVPGSDCVAQPLKLSIINIWTLKSKTSKPTINIRLSHHFPISSKARSESEFSASLLTHWLTKRIIKLLTAETQGTRTNTRRRDDRILCGFFHCL